MAISVSNLTAGIGTTDPQTTASVAPTAGALLILTVSASASSAGAVADSMTVTGLSGTWTQRASYEWGSRRRSWLFTCSNWSGSGTLSLDPGISNFQEIGWVLDQATGVDTTTPVEGVTTGGSGASNSTTRTLTTSGTPGTGDATYSSLALENNINCTPEAGWTALGQTTTGTLGVRRVESAWDSDADTSCAWTWDGSSRSNGGFVLILNVAAAATSANATEATATAAGQQPAVSTGPAAQLASATATANQTGTSASQGAGEATATATAEQPSVSVSPNAGAASATATAGDAQAGGYVQAFAPLASATATGQQPVANVGPTGGQATATATANNPTVQTAAGGGVSYSDDFNRTDANDLGADWDDVAGGMAIRSNKAYWGDDYGAGTFHRQRHVDALPGDDMYAEVTVHSFATGGYSDARVNVRWSTDTSCYEARINNSGEWYINQVTSGGETDVASGSGLSFSFPEVWRLEVSGTSPVHLSLLRDGVEVGNYDDSSGSKITTGTKAGIAGYTAGGSGAVTVDDYSHGELSGGGPGPSVSADAGEAQATAAAENATAEVSGSASPIATTATATATAHNPGTSVSQGAGEATAIATGWEPGIGDQFTDTFDRADANTLGGDWTAVAGTIGIRSNRADFGDAVGAGQLQRHRHNGSLASAEMYAQATINSFPTGGYSDARIMARWSTDTSFYELRVTNSGAWALARVTSGGETDVASGSGLTLALPEVWKLAVQGTTTVRISIYRDGVELANYADSSASRIQTGTHGGIGGFTAGGTGEVTIDDYSHGISGDQAGDAQVATATATAEWDTTGDSVSLNLRSDNPIPLYATAHDATVSVGADTSAAATEATATATAHQAAQQVRPSGGEAAATATAEQPGTSVRVNAGVATATATAENATNQAVVNFVAIAQVATVTATARNAAMVPSSAYTPNVGSAAASAHNASVTITMVVSVVADQPPLRAYAAEEPLRNYDSLAPLASG